MDKKGMSLDKLYPAVIAIVILGVILGIGMYVLIQTSDAISSNSITVAGETVASLNEIPSYVAAATDCGFSSFAVTVVEYLPNASDIPSTEYTVDANLGTITGSGSNTTNEVNITYTYKGASDTSSTGPCGAMTTTSTGLGGLAEWIAVIVVVLAAAIVLGVVISSFGSRPSGV